MTKRLEIRNKRGAFADEKRVEFGRLGRQGRQLLHGQGSNLKDRVGIAGFSLFFFACIFARAKIRGLCYAHILRDEAGEGIRVTGESIDKANVNKGV